MSLENVLFWTLMGGALGLSSAAAWVVFWL